MIAAGRVSCVQFEYGRANLFSRTFIHDYMREYGSRYLIGKLYPHGVRWFDYYSADLDDLLGPNLVMVSRSQRDLARLLSAPKSPIPC